jgi:octaprenyl-diphosphate synthase
VTGPHGRDRPGGTDLGIAQPYTPTSAVQAAAGRRLADRTGRVHSAATPSTPPATGFFVLLYAAAAAPPRADPADLPRLLMPVAEDMRCVDRVIRDRLGSDVPLIATIGDYIIGAGGKRLRPAMVLLIARALGYGGTTHHLLAAVIEFIHTATLLHDDVVDESDLRRNQPTANAMFGNAASVLVGDFLYSRAFQMMVDAGHMRVMRILSDATNRIAEGEVLQLLNVHDPSVDEARYFSVVERKTATLFEAAARIGAVLAGADDATEQACARYGAGLGTAFQVVDDILDYSGNPDDIGKRLGDDLREGKVTLPLIHALQSAGPAQRLLMQNAILEGNGDFAQIAQIVQSNGSLDHARACAEASGAAARAAALHLPDSTFRRGLLELAAFATRRDR